MDYSFGLAFSLNLILLSSTGAALGIIWGAIPALSTTMAMALLVGLSYSMPAPSAIAFIIGVFTGSVFGGAISAIMINIPGTPAAVPTQLAGFPLAKRGQGGLALGVSITASMLGNWVGILLLVASVPIVLKLAMQFASWEVALLAIWGVSLAGNLSGTDRPLKGWISGWLGLLLAMVGRDKIMGVERFVFDQRELLLGVPYIPVLIGLFGLTEVFDSISDRVPYVMSQNVGRIFPNFKLLLKHWKSIIRSSAVGVITGIIPGCGANVATYISYAVGEKATGKDFSKGDLEGVICSEVSNNANIGGALLPSLVLGIPGSAPTAAFIAAMSLHGIILGPTINIEQPGLLHFIYACLIIGNIAMFLIAFALIKPACKLLVLPREILLPIITVIAVVGAFAEKMSMFDVNLMLIFGMVGYLMRLAKVPIGPMVLGVILGGMVDENLRRAFVIFASNDWKGILTRPVGIILFILILVTFLSTLFKGKKKAT